MGLREGTHACERVGCTCVDLEGCFLVRKSSTSQSDYTLSVIFEAKVWHYRVQRLERLERKAGFGLALAALFFFMALLLVWGCSGRFRFYGSEFDTLSELVNYHMQFKGPTLMGVLTHSCDR